MRFLMVAASALAFAATSTAGLPNHEKPATRMRQVAQRIIGSCLAVKEGETVLISGAVEDAPMLEELAVEARKRGAFPMITLASRSLVRRLILDVPVKYDSQESVLERRLAEVVDVMIAVEPFNGDTANEGLPYARVQAQQKMDALILEARLKRAVRTAQLGNNLKPFPDRAHMFGVSARELERIYWDGMNVNYQQLQATGDRVRKALRSGNILKITHPNGTNLTMKLDAAPLLVSDGVVSEADRKAGGAASQVWLPAGEVFGLPAKGTTQGRIIFPRMSIRKKTVEDLDLRFKDGRIVSMKARSGLRHLKQSYEIGSAGKEEASVIDLGINPNVRSPKGSRLTSYVESGSIFFGTGENIWAGGDNHGTGGIGGYLQGATLTVDGKVLIDRGRLK